MDHFADRLAEATRSKGNALCVGLDPRWKFLPLEIQRRYPARSLESVAAAFQEFCTRVVDIVAPHVPVVKMQSAFFEVCGPPGFKALYHVLRKARDHHLITILDGKRNDIDTTALAYARAAFRRSEPVQFDDDDGVQPVWDADGLTVNPYLGDDAIRTFLQVSRATKRSLFILVRTSNPGAKLFQDLMCNDKPLYMHVADFVGRLARENIGNCGYGDVGAVVGATYPAELVAIRKALPDVVFLVPGFGFQGGKAENVAPAFREDGLGVIVNSSRGIIFAFKPEDSDWEAKIEQAARATIAALAEATPMGQLGRDSRPSA